MGRPLKLLLKIVLKHTKIRLHTKSPNKVNI